MVFFGLAPSSMIRLDPLDVLTFIYLTAFQACAIPAILRVIRRRSSADLSVWREWLLVLGVSTQFYVMVVTGADWRVWVSPICSGAGVLAMLVCIYRYRRIVVHEVERPGLVKHKS